MNHIALVLAAGHKEQMHSKTPDMLHGVCGKPLLRHVTDTLSKVCANTLLVLSEENHKQILETMGDIPFVLQTHETGWGTGMAVRAAAERIKGCSGCVIIAAGDMPMVTEESYRRLISAVEEEAYSAALLYDSKPEPEGYGRVIRDEMGNVQRIVEQTELSASQQRVRACNASVYCFRIDALLWALPLIKPENQAHEYYLTDVIGLLSSVGHRVRAIKASERCECMGVNSRADLAAVSWEMRRKINMRLMEGGVTLIDPEHVYIDADVVIGRDTVIYPGCVLEKGTVIGEDCVLYSNCRLSNTRIGDGVTIESSVLLDACVDNHTSVGPYAYLRPNTQVGVGCRIGDFVEIKNSRIGNGTKVSHLTYVGDSDLGEKINLGCGVVFVNYDGKKKQRSTVGDHAFIGCNVNLVAPVNVGNEAYIAAGSTVTCDVPDGAMLIAREREVVKEGWVAARKDAGKL